MWKRPKKKNDKSKAKTLALSLCYDIDYSLGCTRHLPGKIRIKFSFWRDYNWSGIKNCTSCYFIREKKKKQRHTIS